MIPVIYYAHSMQIYNTERERDELERLQHYFDTALIYNPNRPNIQNHQNPMGACFDVVKDSIVTQLAFSHILREIPSGVYAEIRLAQKLNKPVYIINQDSIALYVGVIKLVKHNRASRWARV